MSTFIDNVNRSLITILIFWLIHQIVEPLTFLIKKVEELLSKDLLNWAPTVSVQDWIKKYISMKENF